MKLLGIGVLTAMMPLSPLFALKRPTPENKTHSVHRVQYGIASWYGGRDQGRLMACGEPFDEHEMVAAHRTLPLGTKVRVTNLRNGRSVVVKIKDRGPGVAGRVIDVSKAAARQLHFVGRGLTPVKVHVLSVPGEAPAPRQTAAESSNTAKYNVSTGYSTAAASPEPRSLFATLLPIGSLCEQYGQKRSPCCTERLHWGQAGCRL